MSTYFNIFETTLLKTKPGKLRKVIVNSHTSGTLKLLDAVYNGAAASSTLTSSGAMVPADYATNTLTSSGAMVPASHAITVMTSNGTQVTAGDTITLGSIVYTYRAIPTAAYDIRIGGTVTQTLSNTRKAINGTGIIGYDYGVGTVAHTQIVASASDATTVTLRGRVPGTSLNALATTETAATLSFPDTTLGGGTGASDPGVTTAGATITINTRTYTVVTELSESFGAAAIADQVLWVTSEAVFLANLKKAINATGTSGTEYSTGTVVNVDVIADTLTATTLKVWARTIGTTPNTYPTTETLANYAWADTTLGGGTGVSDPGVSTAAAQFTIGTTTYTGVLRLAESIGLTAVPYQVLWVTSEAVFLDNIKLAINETGLAGTDYSTGTVRHPDVIATTNTNTTQVIVSKKTGTVGNAIATTETMANYAWTGALMAGGTGPEGKVICNTITFSAVATTGERAIDFGDEGLDFTYGLLAVIGGTADLTLEVD